MRLKRLELFGFKSFADRTVIDFGLTTLTGIVGPNGCGKSNVVDAVRWVLGETRPTSMRGSGMTDVIFKGSVSRPAMGTAEVAMVLDNELGKLPERGPEISIMRRLYASGEGEYLIDGQRVRLKDVKDLLFDTGLGSRGYSVLEQGRIDAVLSANPAQRRAIFEEAAGISRYRQRRHETELRLKRCEQDVERLEDVMGELRSRVRSLKIQAGKAEKYVVCKAEWTSGRTRLLGARLIGYDRTLEDLKPAITELEDGLGGLRERRAECEVAIESRERDRSEIVEELSTVGDEASRLSGDLRALEERKSQLAMRIASWAASAEEEAERAEALEAQLGEREEELATLATDIEALRERAAGAEERAQGLAEQTRELGGTYKEMRREVQLQNDAVLARLHERTAAENRLVHLTEALPPAQERLQRVADRYQGAEAQVASVLASEGAARSALQAAEYGVGTADASLQATRAELEAERERLASRTAARGERVIERATLESRVAALLDRDRELEDLSGGARRVLEAAGTEEGPCRTQDLLGLVADHVDADVRLARAIDAVLGDRAHALVARDAHVARAIVDWCASEEVGQVGVVVPPGVGAPDCPPPSDFALFARFGAGVEGRLGDLVRCDEAMRPLVHALFCDVVVVATLDIALDLVGREPGWRFVTPRGELVDAAGIVGGYREVAHGFVGRRSSAADLGGKVEALALAIARDDEAIAITKAKVGTLEEDHERLAGEREAARSAQSDAEAAVSAARARLADLTATLAAQGEERTTALEEVERVESELADAGESRAVATEAFDAENERLEQMERARRQLEAEREDLQREEGRAQVDLSSAKAELAGLEQRITSLERLLVETRSEIDRSRSRATTYGASAEEGRGEVDGIVAEAHSLLSAREDLDAQLEALRERERSGAREITETRRAAEAVQSELDTHAEALGKQRLEAQRADLARLEVVGRAQEELSLDERALRAAYFDLHARVLAALSQDESPEEGAQDEAVSPGELSEAESPGVLAGVVELPDEAELRALDREVAELKKQLDRLGPVNVEAVHELEEVGGRLEHLETQSADLADARKTLLDTIRTIDEESRRLFVETFEEVRGNFQRIFRLLFGGGKADIKLNEDEDVLDAGVEIVARPPGRELLSIGLLSGGQRTMTALALLFAVFEARPSPFCVLDEVDAALDDANIDRFLGMLDGFRESTQFIVVTHNKGTMAASQALYGVTMQVKGVSRFVAVELDEVEEFVPDTVGGKRAGKSGAEAGGSAPAGGPEPPPEAGELDEPAELDESGEPIKELRPASARPFAVGAERDPMGSDREEAGAAEAGAAG